MKVKSSEARLAHAHHSTTSNVCQRAVLASITWASLFCSRLIQASWKSDGLSATKEPGASSLLSPDHPSKGPSVKMKFERAGGKL